LTVYVESVQRTEKRKAEIEAKYGEMGRPEPGSLDWLEVCTLAMAEIPANDEVDFSDLLKYRDLPRDGDTIYLWAKFRETLASREFQHRLEKPTGGTWWADMPSNGIELKHDDCFKCAFLACLHEWVDFFNPNET